MQPWFHPGYLLREEVAKDEKWFNRFFFINSYARTSNIRGEHISSVQLVTSLSFLLNSSCIISLALSHIISGGTPSSWKRRDNVSWASLFSFIGNEHDQPKSEVNICGHSLPLLETLLAMYHCSSYVVIFCTSTDDHLSWTTMIRIDATLCRYHFHVVS